MKIKKTDLNIENFWVRGKFQIGRITTLILIAVWWLTSLGLHFMEHLPPQIGNTIIAILLATCIELMFQIHSKVHKDESEISYQNFNEAANPMRDIILESAQDTGKTVTIDFLGVAMFQGFEWITSDLRQLVHQNPHITLEIRVCMLSRRFLSACDFDNTLTNWPELAHLHLEGLKEMMYNKELSCNGRLQIKSIYVYEYLPQWHGILINHHRVFLGHSDWVPGSFEQGSKPIFCAGQNKYRYFFTRDAIKGCDEINRFENWFNYAKRIAFQIHEHNLPISKASA